MSAAGIAVGLADLWLNTLRNTNFSAPITCIQLHVGQPGADGMQNPSAVTARKSASFTAGNNGGFALTGTPPSWVMSTAETLTHISVWSGYDGDGSAIFLWSMPLTVPKQVTNGDTYNQNSCNLGFATVAA